MANFKNPFLAIQYHLYEHSLYKCYSNTDASLDVIIIRY